MFVCFDFFKTNNIGLYVYKCFSAKCLLLMVVKKYCALLTADTVHGPHWANGMNFLTYDRDQDTISANCAQRNHGAWWYWNCGHEDPNGPYLTPGTHRLESMSYVAFLGRLESLRAMQLMFR